VETNPELAAELVDQSLADKVTAGSHKKLRWRCKLRHEWAAVCNSRVLGNNCPYCANKKVLPGFNDMATTHPELAVDLIGDATKIMAGTNKKLRWRCNVGHGYEATGNNRVNKGSGCPKCAESGYNPSKTGIFYLVCRPGQFKLGIMNIGTGRLDQHHRSGWAILDTIELSGELARSIETIAKRMLKKKGIPTGAKAFRQKFDGYSEAWNAVDLDVTSIDDLLKKLGTSFEAILAA
jgi:hypothetical protein